MINIFSKAASLYRLIKNEIKSLFNGNVSIHRSVQIKKNTKISAVNQGQIKIGAGSTISSGTAIESVGGVIVLDGYNFINRNCILSSLSEIHIEKGVTIGPNSMIYDHDHNYHGDGQTRFISKPVVIGENTWIGAGVIILKGVNIGRNVVIGAGSIVTKDIKDNTLYLNEVNVITRDIK